MFSFITLSEITLTWFFKLLVFPRSAECTSVVLDLMVFIFLFNSHICQWEICQMSMFLTKFAIENRDWLYSSHGDGISETIVVSVFTEATISVRILG